MYMLLQLVSRNYMVKNLAACCRMLIITKDGQIQLKIITIHGN